MATSGRSASDRTSDTRQVFAQYLALTHEAKKWLHSEFEKLWADYRLERGLEPETWQDGPAHGKLLFGAIGRHITQLSPSFVKIAEGQSPEWDAGLSAIINSLFISLIGHDKNKHKAVYVPTLDGRTVNSRTQLGQYLSSQVLALEFGHNFTAAAGGPIVRTMSQTMLYIGMDKATIDSILTSVTWEPSTDEDKENQDLKRVIDEISTCQDLRRVCELNSSIIAMPGLSANTYCLAHGNLARALLEQINTSTDASLSAHENWSRALAEANLALETCPAWHLPHHYIAQVVWRRGDTLKAAFTMYRAKTLCPKSAKEFAAIESDFALAAKCIADMHKTSSPTPEAKVTIVQNLKNYKQPTFDRNQGSVAPNLAKWLSFDPKSLPVPAHVPQIFSANWASMLKLCKLDSDDPKSETAKNTIVALKHFELGMSAIYKNDIATCLMNLNKMLDLEWDAVVIPTDTYRFADLVLTTVSDMHLASRRVVAALYAHNTAVKKGSVNAFFERSLMIYPGEPIFYKARSCVLRRKGLYQEALDDINKAIQLDHNDLDSLYRKLSILSYKEDCPQEEALELGDMLIQAMPSHHRRLPAVHYLRGLAYALLGNKDLTKAAEAFKRGEAAESNVLPCWLPYLSTFKTDLELALEGKAVSSKVQASSSSASTSALFITSDPSALNPNLLKDSARAATVAGMNTILAQLYAQRGKPFQFKTSASITVTRAPTGPIGSLPPIALKDIDRFEVKVYKNRLLQGYIISRPLLISSLYFVIADLENQEVMRVSLKDMGKLTPDQINQEFAIYRRVMIASPFHKHALSDGQSLIQVDHLSNIFTEEVVFSPCDVCGKPNAEMVCTACNVARYCSKECQAFDWKDQGHKIACPATRQ